MVEIDYTDSMTVNNLSSERRRLRAPLDFMLEKERQRCFSAIFDRFYSEARKLKSALL